jgi:hypothetical protein
LYFVTRKLSVSLCRFRAPLQRLLSRDSVRVAVLTRSEVHEALVNPFPVFVTHELVGKHAATLVQPERKQSAELVTLPPYVSFSLSQPSGSGRTTGDNALHSAREWFGGQILIDRIERSGSRQTQVLLAAAALSTQHYALGSALVFSRYTAGKIRSFPERKMLDWYRGAMLAFLAVALSCRISD